MPKPPAALPPSPGSARLDPARRGRDLEAMAAVELDVLVIGGGVVGAGCALDAVSRGLDVGLVEARDLASGTSSRSSKLIHGGLRYLEMLDFALVKEALTERGLLLDRLAPHLVHPVPFLYPLTRRVWERPYVGAGMILYDTMGVVGGTTRGVPRHHHLSRKGALARFPSLRPDALVGGIQYWDGQVDDARHTMMVARTAAGLGAKVASRTEVTSLDRVGPRVVGAHVVDLESGTEYQVRAKVVVNATGVWTDETQRLATDSTELQVRASKGVHLLVPRDRMDGEVGLILRTETSVLFVIPWGRHWIIGTTDTDWDLDLAHPAASKADIDYLLERVNQVLIRPLTHRDIEGVYAGLRPLLSGESEATSKLSREHQVSTPVPGLVVIAGGKYTTYRVMAADALDAAAKGLGGQVPASTTDRLPLLGAEGYHALVNGKDRLARTSGLAVATIEHLLGRYGSLTLDLLALVADRPELGEPLIGAEEYLAAEVVYAAAAEGALHLEDILTRRTRISIETSDRGVKAARAAAELVAPTLGWDSVRLDGEVDHYLARVAAERESQETADDRSADATRLGAPDIVALRPLGPAV